VILFPKTKDMNKQQNLQDGKEISYQK